MADRPTVTLLCHAHVDEGVVTVEGGNQWCFRGVLNTLNSFSISVSPGEARRYGILTPHLLRSVTLPSRCVTLMGQAS